MPAARQARAGQGSTRASTRRTGTSTWRRRWRFTRAACPGARRAKSAGR